MPNNEEQTRSDFSFFVVCSSPPLQFRLLSLSSTPPMEDERRSLIDQRFPIRRNLLRQTRALPYEPSASNRRRRATSSIVASPAISDLLTNIEESSPEQNTTHLFTPIDRREDDDVQDRDNRAETTVSVDNRPIESMPAEQQESYHSLSTIDFDPDDLDDEHRFYYTSSSSPIPVFDYSLDRHLTGDDGEDEDLSIEIIFEPSHNLHLPPEQPRRHSIIPSSRGLRLSDILSIPQSLFCSLNDKSPVNTQCSICLEDFQSLDSIKRLSCQHVYHV